MKKIISILLIFCLIISALPVLASADTLYATEESVYDRALELVEGLGILTDTNSENDVSRAEFVSAVVKMFGMDIDIENPGNVYSDVTKENSAYKDIAIAYSLDWISPSSDRNFYPNGAIRTNEALKIILCAMQYRDRAEMSGGFPTGYMSLAIDLKLLKNVKTGSDFLTRENAVMLIYNTLHTACPQVKGITTNSIVSYEVGNNTVMEVFFDVYLLKAQVVSAGVTNLFGQKNEQASKAQLKRVGDGRIFEVKDIDGVISDNAGEQMEIYLQYDESDDTYNCVAAFPYRQSVEIFEGSDISDFVRESNNFHFYKTVKATDGNTDKRKIKYSYKNSITVLLNDMFQYDVRPVFEILKQENTDYNVDRIKIIDINDDGVCDVLSVYAYKNYIADSVDVLWDKVRTRGDVESLDISRDTNDVYNENGTEIINEYIMLNSVLSVYERPADEKLIKNTIYVSNKYVDGIVEEIDSDDETVKVSGQVLSFAADAKDAIGTLMPGYEYRFFMDSCNLVAHVKKIELSNDLEGYFVIDKYALEGNGIKKELQIRAFDIKKSEVILVNAPKKVVINDHLYRLSDDTERGQIDTLLSEAKLVYMKLNSDGEVKVIRTPSENSGDFRYVMGVKGKKTMKYKKSLKAFYSAVTADYGAYTLLTDTYRTSIVIAPTDTCTDEEARERTYKISTMDYFVNDIEYEVEGYALNDYGLLSDIIVAYVKPEAHTPIITASPVFVVDHVINARNYSDNFGQKIVGYQSGQPRSYISADTFFKDLSGNTIVISPGDVLKVQLDMNGECSGVERIYNYANNELSTNAVNSYASSNRIFRGKVYSADGNLFSVIEESQLGSVGGNLGAKLNNYASSKYMYYVNLDEEKGERVRVGSTADMRTYVRNKDLDNTSDVIMMSQYAQLLTTVIIEK